jgi:hypothetical protein
MNDDTGFRRMSESEALAIAVRRAEKAERERDEALKRVRDRDEVIGNLHVALREAELGEAKSDLNATRVLRERDEARRELQYAAESLATLAHACAQNGFDDLIDVRGYAHDRWRVACDALLEHQGGDDG